MIFVMTFGSSLWLVEYDEQLAKAICKVGNVNDFQLMMSTNQYNQFNNKLKQILMLVKDLPDNVRLTGAKIKTGKGVIGFVINEFDNGIMLSTLSLKQYNAAEGDAKRLYPQIIENKEDMKQWEIVESKDIACNCDKLIDHEHIMNFVE